MKLIRREIALALILALGILGAISASNTPESVVLGATTCGIAGCVSTPSISSSTSYQYTATSPTSTSTTSTSFTTIIYSSTTSTSATTTTTSWSYTSTISTTMTSTTYSTYVTGTEATTNTILSTVQTITSSPTTYTYVVTQRGNTAPSCPVAFVTTGNILEGYANFLRSFRNNMIQNTTAGRQFMLTFNAWYYSWAPSLSYSAANNPWVFKAVELSAYPLIGILYASYYTYSLVAPFNTEAGAITAGIVAASLLGAVFVAPVVYVTIRIFKRRLRISKLTIGPSATWFMASVMICIASYLASSEQLLAIATSSMVLSTLSLGSLLGARTLTYVQTPFGNSASMAIMFRRFAKRPF